MAATANSNGDAAPVGRDFLTLREAVKLTNCRDLPPGMEPVSKLGLVLPTDQPCSFAEA